MDPKSMLGDLSKLAVGLGHVTGQPQQACSRIRLKLDNPRKMCSRNKWSDDFTSFNFTEVHFVPGLWLWEWDLSCSAYNTLGFSCHQDFGSLTLDVPCSCSSLISCRISMRELRWSHSTSCPNSHVVGPSLNWYLTKHPFQGTWKSLRLESLISCCSAEHWSIPWVYFSLEASGVTTFTVSIDSVLFSHMDTGTQEESRDCPLLSLCWCLSLHFLMDSNFPFRSYPSPGSTSLLFFSKLLFSSLNFQILGRLVCFYLPLCHLPRSLC